MPVMDGFEASAELTEMMLTFKIPTIPIIACTAHALDEDIEKCKKNGMSIHLLKPVSIRKLEETLKKVKIQFI